MPRRIRITYDIVTPESAAEGDFAESGWIDQDGIEITPDADDIDEYGSELDAVVHLTCRQVGSCVEPSSSQFHAGVWYTDADPDRNYRDGSETRQSYHLDEFTENEEREIYHRLTRRR